MKKYKSIVFDCYGTLYLFGDMKKAWSDWVDTFYRAAKNAGMQAPKKEFLKFVDGFMGQPKPEQCEDNFSLYEQRVKNKLVELGCNFSDSTIKSIAQNTVDAWHNEISVDPNAVKTLQLLGKRYRISLLSNFDHPQHIYKILKEDKILPYFEEVVISGEVGVDKPDPGIFKILLNKINLLPEVILYIGDSEEDYLGSAAAGIDFLLIRRSSIVQNKIALDYRSDTSSLEDDWSKIYDGEIDIIASLQELINFVKMTKDN